MAVHRTRVYTSTKRQDEAALRGWPRPVYLVHEHHSRSHHFDLRLELDGVLKSWAVPKGLSGEPGVRRLARQVPDHALAYAPFQGTIPAGSYGAGRVEIWDRGTFRLVERGPDRIVVELRGQRVRGTYTLVRTALRGDPKNWLVVRQEEAPAPPSAA